MLVCHSLRMGRMNKRWLIGGGLLVVVVGGYYLLHDNSTAQAMTKPAGRNGAIRTIQVQGQPQEVAVVAPPKPVDPLRPDGLITHAPAVTCDPTGKYCRREMVDAVPDEAAHQREELQYHLIRLRLAASDAAAPCYTGDDSNDTIHIKYNAVIKGGALHSDNVQVLDSTLGDGSLKNCILQSVRDMADNAEGIGDLAQPEELVMSMHDLWKRNRSAATQEQDRKTTVNAQPTPTDLPPAQVPQQ